MKYINKILLTFFIAFTILLSGKYSASANVPNNRNFSEYLENTNYKTKNNSYELIKLNDYMIPEGEEDEIITINPSSDNSNNTDTNISNNIDNIADKNTSDNLNNKTETEESSLETKTPENNIISETSSAEANLETSTSSALPETSTSSATLTPIDEGKSQTATPSANSLSKNTNNSSSGSSNTSEENFDRFDLAIANFMIFLLFVTILLYKFSPKVKALIKLMTLDKDEV